VFDREESHSKQPKRGIRGGMFTDDGMHLRAARRQWGDVSVSDIGIGFRCVR
jgi:formylglycine-generating enzyme required for sulfatase activity